MTLGFRDKEVKIGSSSLPNRLVPVEEPHAGGLDTANVYQSLDLYFWVCGRSTLLEVRRGYVILLDNEP